MAEEIDEVLSCSNSYTVSASSDFKHCNALELEVGAHNVK